MKLVELKSIINTVYEEYEKFVKDVRFRYEHPDANPALIQFNCEHNIHFFEADSVIYDHRGAPIGARLKCKHCSAKSESYFNKVRI